jgi:anti-sigma regulatory factor (Ser/Thr protein kinase)
VVDAAIEQYREMQALRDSSLRVEHALKYLDQGTFYCRTMTEARNLAQGLALVYPDPQRAAYGLQELLYNAVEHGNLGISYAEKKRLLIDGQLVQTIDERLADPVLGSRRVTARLVRQSGWLSLTIEDQGEGFDWSSYVDLDPERSTDPNGRGIALTRMTSFDSLDYEGSGNRVVVKMMTGNE